MKLLFLILHSCLVLSQAFTDLTSIHQNTTKISGVTRKGVLRTGALQLNPQKPSSISLEWQMLYEDKINITLFPDVSVEFLVKTANRQANGAVYWSGISEEEWAISLYLNNGRLCGSVYVGASTYVIEQSGEGALKVTEMDVTQLPEESLPVQDAPF